MTGLQHRNAVKPCFGAAGSSAMPSNPEEELRPYERSVQAPPPTDAGLVFIGRIHTPWATRSDCPRRGSPDGPICRIEVFPLWAEALQGVSEIARLEVFYWLHRSRRDLVLQTPRRDGVTRGTFSLRSPVRPNPIGTSVVTLLSVEGTTLLVRGLDCIDGTPLIDLKPDRSAGRTLNGRLRPTRRRVDRASVACFAGRMARRKSTATQHPGASGDRLSLRIDLASGGRIGPGKVAVLEAIGESGSISGAGRALGMSYRRTWALVEELNNSVGRIVVEASAGGSGGGGATLTDAGRAVIACYRAIERDSLQAARKHLAALHGSDGAV
eukprot:gene5484-5540_t